MVNTARSAGFDLDMEAQTSLESARSWLERGLQGKRPLPRIMVLDLDLGLGLGSGYEFLRLRHHAPALSEIHTIVRSGIAEENRRICELFNVDFYIPKWEGAAALQEALQTLNPLGRSNDPRHRIIEPRLAKPGRFQATLSSAGSTS